MRIACQSFLCCLVLNCRRLSRIWPCLAFANCTWTASNVWGSLNLNRKPHYRFFLIFCLFFPVKGDKLRELSKKHTDRGWKDSNRWPSGSNAVILTAELTPFQLCCEGERYMLVSGLWRLNCAHSVPGNEVRFFTVAFNFTCGSSFFPCTP